MQIIASDIAIDSNRGSPTHFNISNNYWVHTNTSCFSLCKLAYKVTKKFPHMQAYGENFVFFLYFVADLKFFHNNPAAIFAFLLSLTVSLYPASFLLKVSYEYSRLYHNCLI